MIQFLYHLLEALSWTISVINALTLMVVIALLKYGMHKAAWKTVTRVLWWAAVGELVAALLFSLHGDGRTWGFSDLVAGATSLAGYLVVRYVLRPREEA